MTKKTSASDRRQFKRIEPKPGKPIRVNVNGEDFIDIFNAVDISIGGVGLKVPHEFKGCELNRVVSFIIDLPLASKQQCVQVRGRILHISGQKFGVSFTEMSEANREKIRKYISERIKEESLVDWLMYEVSNFFRPNA